MTSSKFVIIYIQFLLSSNVGGIPLNNKLILTTPLVCMKTCMKTWSTCTRLTLFPHTLSLHYCVWYILLSLTHTCARTHTCTRAVSHHVSVSESEDGEVELEEHPSATWISAIARGTVDKYVMNILKIPRLTDRATQQLAIDIGM